MKASNKVELQCIRSAHDFRIFYARERFEKLRVQLGRCKQNLTQPHLPKTKTVLDLWYLYGIDQNRHGEHRTIWLLNQWLDILHGEGTAKRMNIEKRCSQKRQRNVKINMPSYTEENATHFHFRNPFDVVLEDVSAGLPPYQ